MANPTNDLDLDLTQPTQVSVTSDELLPVIAKIEDALEGEPQHLAFFALLAIAIINQYPGMTDDQISTGIHRIAMNVVQMAQEFEFENKLKERVAEKAAIKIAN